VRFEDQKVANPGSTYMAPFLKGKSIGLDLLFLKNNNLKIKIEN